MVNLAGGVLDRAQDGAGTIICRMVQHGDIDYLDVTGGDPDGQKTEREETEKDRNVELTFRIPAAVKDRILGL